MEALLKEIDKIENRYKELQGIFSKSQLNNEELKKLAKENSSLEDIMPKIKEYRKILKEISGAESVLSAEKNSEMISFAKQEIAELLKAKDPLEEDIRFFISAPEGLGKNIFVEIRAGAGGEEAALFVSDLLRMYLRYVERKGWKSEMISSNPTGIGGFKEVIFKVEGKDAFRLLRYESGVHRVQRVPITEAGGRIHTSTITVAVLPEAEDVDVEIKPEDIRMDTFRASGHGGQHMQKTDSAVRITHIPTGIVAACQDDRSQQKNRQKAMAVIRARLLMLREQEQADKITSDRRQQIGTAERNEKIRTYNYPQNRVSDHRINLDLYNLSDILNGNLDEFVIALSKRIL